MADAKIWEEFFNPSLGGMDADKLADALAKCRRKSALDSHYISTYGNGSGRCEYGYVQHSGYICGLCGHDNSDGGMCPRMENP